MLFIKTLNFINKKRTTILSIIALFFFVFFSIIFIQFTIDDSFINFRYAKNLIHYGLWNWNPDQDYVEAYTGIIYPLLALFPEYLGMSTPLFFKLFSIGLVVLLLLRVRTSLSKETFVILLLLMALNWMFYIHMYSGLETILFIFLLFESNIILIKLISGSKYNETYLWFICFLLPLVRIEGVLLSMSIFALIIYYNGRIDKKIICSIFILLLTAYYIWRHSYFDSLLPNPVYLKGIHQAGIGNLFGNLYKGSSYIIVVILLIAVIRKNSFTIVGVTSILFFLIAYSYSSLMMNYADRFFFQIFYPTILTAVLFLNAYNRSKLILLFTFVIVLAYHNNLNEIKELTEYYPRAVNSYKKAGEIFSRYTNKETKLLLLDAGMIPYYTDMKCYDGIGLANKYVAHHGLDLEYVASVNPDLIILNSSSPKESDITSIPGQKIIRDYINTSSYQLLPSVKYNDSSYLLIYVRNDNVHRVQMYEEFKNLQTRDNLFSIRGLFFLKYI